jgi:SAM-dependent methyltransferase
MLLKTGNVDHADWVFKPLLGSVMRMRYRLVQALLASHSARRLLEVGYGSGILMPELSRHCRELYGIDVHPYASDVEAILARAGVAATLTCGTIEAAPFEAAFFDTVVAVSSIEFVADLTVACREIRRILTPEGCFIVITPGHSRWLDLGLRLLTGKSAKADYGERREALLPTLHEHFVEEVRLQAPRLATSAIRCYTGMLLRPETARSPNAAA